MYGQTRDLIVSVPASLVPAATRVRADVEVATLPHHLCVLIFCNEPNGPPCCVAGSSGLGSHFIMCPFLGSLILVFFSASQTASHNASQTFISAITRTANQTPPLS